MKKVYLEKDQALIVGINIGRLRQNRGWSLEQVADALSISKQAVSQWERGESGLRYASLEKVAELFGVDANDMLMHMEIPDRPCEGVNKPLLRSSINWDEDGYYGKCRECCKVVKASKGCATAHAASKS